MWVMNAHNTPGGLRLFITSFIAWCLVYGSVCVFIKLLSHWFLALALPLATVAVIKRFGIPKPDIDDVNSTLGCLEDSGLSKKPMVPYWAHRFAGGDAPENTVEAFDLCIKNGAKAVEFDVHMTRDFVAVVLHEGNLKLKAGLDEDVKDLPWSQVKTLSIELEERFKGRYKNVRIPKFEAIIERCLSHKVRAIIDIKDLRQEMVNKILHVFRTHPDLYGLACISCFNPSMIWRIRKKDPKIVGCLAWFPCTFTHEEYSCHRELLLPFVRPPQLNYWLHVPNIIGSFLFHFFVEDVIGISAVLIHKDALSASDVTAWLQRRVRVLVWTVNDPVEKKYFIESLGVSVITDLMTNM